MYCILYRVLYSYTVYCTPILYTVFLYCILYSYTVYCTPILCTVLQYCILSSYSVYCTPILCTVLLYCILYSYTVYCTPILCTVLQYCVSVSMQSCMSYSQCLQQNEGFCCIHSTFKSETCQFSEIQDGRGPTNLPNSTIRTAVQCALLNPPSTQLYILNSTSYIAVHPSFYQLHSCTSLILPATQLYSVPH